MATAIRVLAMDAVERAASGHPGMPMGMADAATVLFARHLKFDAAAPGWPDRDRFVLSAGHGSMLLYALLHLLGYEEATMAEIENFRQLGAKTAGHPEYGHLPGVETTTGPLGQGIATAVGMALAERMVNARFGDGLVDHFTYVIASDGDLMEGISQEAIAFAGHLELDRLIVLFDDNDISIDGSISLADSVDQLKRFEAAGWSAERVDGHDPEAVDAAIERAKKSGKPSLIACKTVIGKGAPNKQGTAATHGAALGADEVAAAREELGWKHAPFVLPDNVVEAWRMVGAKGRAAREEWEARLAAADPAERAEFERRMAGETPAALGEEIARHVKGLLEAPKAMATRKASGAALAAVNEALPEAVGGSADLTGSVNTRSGPVLAVTPENYGGRFIHYGIREHGMAAAMNGMALHGGILPYSGTFLVFADYCRPAIRLSALMGLRVVYVMTHDSIGLGEDGPTHQPVEHLASLRAMPNLIVLRPADAVETAEAWEIAVTQKATPSVLSLTRQDVPQLRLEASAENLTRRGAYELRPAEGGEARVTLIATGSEVSLAVEAREILGRKGIGTRVVSMPSWELFEAQDEAYRRAVLRPDTVRVAVEAAVGLGWERWTGEDGGFVGMSSFGASAPYKDLYRHFGITAEAVADLAESKLAARGARAGAPSGN